MSALARIPRRRPVLAPVPGRLSPALRIRIENAIEALIILLDTADGDADLEDGGDTEPIDEREPEDEGDPLDIGEHDPAEELP